jgi:hypothetical protein
MIFLKNNTRGLSRIGYLVKLSDRPGYFEYAGSNDIVVGIVAEEVPDGASCMLKTGGGGYIFSYKKVYTGGFLRQQFGSDGGVLGTAMPVRDNDAGYYIVGKALEDGKGLVKATIKIAERIDDPDDNLKDYAYLPGRVGDTLHIDDITEVTPGAGVTIPDLNVSTNITLSVGATINEFSTDDSLAGNSNTAVPTEKAVKTYVDNQISGVTLHKAYTNGNTITTSLAEGDVIIAGTEQLHVTATDGVTIDNALSSASIVLAAGATIVEFSIDGTLAGNSDTVVPTEKAVKTYVDTEISGVSLQDAYISGNTITTSLSEGDVVIAGTEQLHISATDGLLVDNNIGTGSILFDTTYTSPTMPEGMMCWNLDDWTMNISTGRGPVLQVNQETVIIVYNGTGSTIFNGKAIYPVGGFNGRPSVALANATTHVKILGEVLVTTMDIPHGGYGLCTRFGAVRNINTTSWGLGDTLWVSADTDGELTNVRPSFPNYAIQLGGVTVIGTTDGEIAVDTKGIPEDTVVNFWNGVFRETIDFLVTSNGSVVTGSLSPANGHEDMTMMFSDGFTMLDTTPAATITLTPGSDAVPTSNFIYIPKSTKVLTVSTSDWPATEHIKVATVVLRSAATTQTDGALGNQNWNDHVQSTNNNQGHLSHITERLRQEHARWKSGIEATVTIVNGSPDDVYVAVTSGVVYQLHKQSFPAIDMQAGGDIHIVNNFANPYITTTNLNTQTLDSLGNSLNNSSFSFVFWGIANKAGETSHIMCNLPSGGYLFAFPDQALEDANNYTDYTIPDQQKGRAFLIARATFTYKNGAWVLYDLKDLRGFTPNSSAGGGVGGVGVTTFSALTDTPNSNIGEALKVPRVNALESGLEYIDLDTLYLRNTTDTLTGDLTITGGLTVDTDTLVVDDVNNRVGIGTASPLDNLHIRNGATTGYTPSGVSTVTVEDINGGSIALLSGSSGTSYLIFGDDTDNKGYLKYDHSNDAMTLRANGTSNQLVLNSTGNVGIGTPDPGAYKLNVNGDTNISGGLVVDTDLLVVDDVGSTVSVVGTFDVTGTISATSTITPGDYTNFDARYYTQTISDGKYLLNTTDTLTGNLTVTADLYTTTVKRNVSNSNLLLYGGDADGGFIELYGGSHGSFPNHLIYNATQHTFRDYDLSPIYMTISSTGINIGVTTNVAVLDVSSSLTVDSISDSGAGIITISTDVAITGGLTVDTDSLIVDDVTGAVTMANLGSDDTEDHVLAIDDSTGLITKRSVASISGGDVYKVGTPVNNEMARWTGDGTLASESNVTFDGSVFDITGGLDVTANIRVGDAVSSGAGHRVHIGDNTDSNSTYVLYVEQNPFTTEGSTNTVYIRGETSTYATYIQNAGTGGGLYVADSVYINDNFEVDGGSGVNTADFGTTLDRLATFEAYADGGRIELGTTTGAQTVQTTSTLLLYDNSHNQRVQITGTAATINIYASTGATKCSLKPDDSAIPYTFDSSNTLSGTDKIATFKNNTTEKCYISHDGTVVSQGDSMIIATTKTPASAGATGTTGQIAWDSSYIYVCVATDTWERAAISSWT